MPRTKTVSKPIGADAPPPGSLAAIESIEAHLRAQIQPRDAISALLVWRAAALAGRLDAMTIYDTAMTARRVRYARVDRFNQRWAEVIAVARTIEHDPTDVVRRLRQTPEGIDWLIREWELLHAEVSANLPTMLNAATVTQRVRLFLGLHYGEQDGGAWVTHCRELANPRWPYDSEEYLGHKAWVLAWAADHLESLRKERAALDHAAEEQDKVEATARALFDPGPDAERARRHEANADRSLLRTIRELERVKARAAKEVAAGGGRTQAPATAPGTIEPIAAPAGPATWRPSGWVVAEGANPTIATPPAR